ncbi:acyl-CoA thioesterase [Allopontixanthobacter sediminis]|uniref:Acyl-CoA thioesterase n=1 Tax=Allopontixanthobacter sediminis TaxID=1689985 RepID=A0A845B4B1_9SPHN|nr:acyl-CoA thioesterase [Allopontixanthobacter sediminis]
MSNRFTRTFTAGPDHIDVMGHVNNAVWVQWVQDMATAHWEAAARPEDKEAFVWLVIRHEIDYRGNISVGQSVTAETWIPDGARGAKSNRRVDFTDSAGRVIVSASTTWAMLDRETGRLARVRPEVMAPFAQP